MSYYRQYINLGTDATSSKNQLKKIKLFNAFTLTWYFIASLLILRRLPNINKEYPSIIAHLGICVILVIAQILHKNKYYTIGRALYIFCILLVAFYFSNFISPGNHHELYYIIAPPISLIFIDNKYINFGVLAISILLFALPNYFFDIYDKEVYNDLINYFLFIIIFIIVNYFKNINQKNEAELQRKSQELKDLNQFKTQFFTNISHEIRTPITIIKGQIEELKYNIPQTPEVIQIESTVHKQVNKITEMINDVLDLAKMQTTNFKLKTKPYDIKQLIERIYMSFEPLFKQNKIDFHKEINCKNTIVNIDVIYVERAINNIIINALKYTDKGKVTISLTENNNKMSIAISDTGIGINPKDITKIFNRFYQINNDINKAGGSGIGLAFSKEIIELNGGKLTVKSELNQGSTFVISLPLSNSKYVTIDLEEKKQTTSFKGIPVVNSLKTKDVFLIVDDNTDMLTYLKNILSNVQCIEAENGEDALKKLQSHKIDFIITDYMMPKMNGYAFIKKLRELQYNIPVIMLTAKVDYKSKISVLRLGADDYMVKPFEKEELLIRVQYLLKNYKKRKEYIKNTIQDEEINEKELSIIENIQKYIYDNCSNTKLTQNDIATKFGISKSSLYRKLKTEIGLSPQEFLTEIKLQKAKEILAEQPTILLKQLALEVGFKHTSHFSKKYTQRFGTKI